MEVLRLIADSSSYLYNLTSSIHLVGVSLGGHAALYAGLFASLHPLAAAGPQLQSVMGYCPVIRLKETLQRLDSEDSLYGRHYRSVIWDEVSGFPNLVDLPLVKPGRNEAVTFLEKVLLRIYKEGTSLPYLYPEPYKGLKIKTAEDYWDANDFTRFYRDMRIPTMVIASENDPVVAAEPNSLYFKKILAQAPHSDIGVVTFPLGFHCAAQIIYGLDVFVPLFRDFILSHSPEFHVKTASFALAAAVPAKALSLEKGEKYFGGDWSIKERQTRATLDLIVFEPNKIFANRLCSSWSPYYAPHECFRNISLRIPLLALFGSGDASRKYPRTEVDAQILTRWLNLRVKIQTAAGDQLIATREPPATLTYEMQ